VEFLSPSKVELGLVARVSIIVLITMNILMANLSLIYGISA